MGNVGLNRLWNSSTRLTLALGLFALIAMFVVAACGDGDDDAAPAAETTSDAPEVVQGITIPPKGASTILDNDQGAWGVESSCSDGSAMARSEPFKQ